MNLTHIMDADDQGVMVEIKNSTFRHIQNS